jgi:hypothetical protein
MFTKYTYFLESRLSMESTERNSLDRIPEAIQRAIPPQKEQLVHKEVNILAKFSLPYLHQSMGMRG